MIQPSTTWVVLTLWISIPQEEPFDRWVAQLAHPDPDRRVEAEAALVEMGEPVVGRLEDLGRTHTDLEVSARAQSAVRKIWGQIGLDHLKDAWYRGTVEERPAYYHLETSEETFQGVPAYVLRDTIVFKSKNGRLSKVYAFAHTTRDAHFGLLQATYGLENAEERGFPVPLMEVQTDIDGNRITSKLVKGSFPKYRRMEPRETLLGDWKEGIPPITWYLAKSRIAVSNDSESIFHPDLLELWRPEDDLHLKGFQLAWGESEFLRVDKSWVATRIVGDYWIDGRRRLVKIRADVIGGSEEFTRTDEAAARRGVDR